ncbi:MAG: THUMP domain-containing protein [Thioalkalivibrionaceae bacterium]
MRRSSDSSDDCIGQEQGSKIGANRDAAPPQVTITQALTASTPVQGFVACARLLEPLLFEELERMPGVGAPLESASDDESTLQDQVLSDARDEARGEVRETRGGVFWAGPPVVAARIVLGSRLASRVLVERARVRGTVARLQSDDVYQLSLEVPWEALLADGASLAVSVVPRRADITHTGFAAQRVKDAIVDRLRATGHVRPDVDRQAPDVPLVVVVDGPEIVVSQDLTGEALFRRALRVVETEAPLREDVAAAVLMRAGWPDEHAALCDPMCGSGTFLSEAALMALDLAPGLLRVKSRWIAAQGLRGEEGVWARAEQMARGEARVRLDRRIDACRARGVWPALLGADLDAVAIAAVRARWQALREAVAAVLSMSSPDSQSCSREMLDDGAAALVSAVSTDGDVALHDRSSATVPLPDTSDERAPSAVVGAGYARRYAVDAWLASVVFRQASLESLAPPANMRPAIDANAHSQPNWPATAFAASAAGAGTTDSGASSREAIARRATPTALLVTNPPWGLRLDGDAAQEAGRALMTKRSDSSADPSSGLASSYRSFGQALRGAFAGWSGALLSAWPEAAVAVGCSWSKRYALRVGALDATLWCFDPMPAGQDASRHDDVDSLSDSAREVYNRLRKMWARRVKQARRQGWCAFRIYDSDLPEFAFAVDVYHADDGDTDSGAASSGDADRLSVDACLADERRRVVVAEYAPPADIDFGLSGRRRRDFLRALRLALNVPRERVFLKTRERQRGRQQYQRHAEVAGPEAVFWIREGRARLKIDLAKYLDSGLFLDHRIVRGWIGDLLAERAPSPAAKPRAVSAHDQAPHRVPRFLNLFAYTATASVHAALVGASTVSVDLSPVYLGWASENLAANGFVAAPIEGVRGREGVRSRMPADGITGPRVFSRSRSVTVNAAPVMPVHRLVRADVVAWLDIQASAEVNDADAFDVILLDPPSFSTSKRMDHAFDVQRDHVALIDSAMRLLRGGGCLIFSNNLRRFKLDPGLGSRFDVEDRGLPSIPDDFERNRRIHHCWWFRHRS